MATIRAHGSFVPFNLPLEGDGCVVVLEYLFGLRFSLQERTMYLEQEICAAGGKTSRTIFDAKE